MRAVNADTRPGVVNKTPSDHRPASCDTSLVVSGGDCSWRGKDDEMFMTRSFNVTPKTS